MQVQPIDVNPIILTPEQNTQARNIITNVITDVVQHPDNFDFIPIVIKNVLALSNKWFHILAKKNDYQATLPQITATYIDVKIITEIFKDIFKISLKHEAEWGDATFNKPDSVIPKGLIWNRLVPAYRYSVTCSWHLGNAFINPQAEKASPLAKELAASMYKEEELKIKAMPSDFTIKVLHNNTEAIFAAHKLKLACHSEMFFQLFDTAQFKEANSGEITIADHSPQAVQAMVDYIYSRELDPSLSPEQVLAVTKLAHQYRVKSLVIACEERLSNHLDKHFEEIFEVAVELELKNLLPFCLNEIGQNENRIQAFINSITAENFAQLYEMAEERKLPTLLKELTMWTKYNAKARRFEITIEPAANPDDIDLHHQPGKD